jgi:5S rRNA maturation endonuclease (ribonuclease M5)
VATKSIEEVRSQSGNSNDAWGEFAAHDSELSELWERYDRLPEPGANPALDAFCEAKNVSVGALVRQGARLAEPQVLAFPYGGKGVKFRDIVTGRRWAWAGSEFPQLKIVARAQQADSNRVIVVESETDGARLSDAYPTADVAVMPAGAMCFTQEYANQLSEYEQVLMALDNDKAGEDGAAKISEFVGHAQRFAPPEGNDWAAYAGEFPPLPGPPRHGASVLLRQSQTDKLLAVMADPPPVTFLPASRLGESIFYEGSLSILAGHKKEGKSFAMLLQAEGMLDAGRPVVFLDNENGFDVFGERLHALDADGDSVSQWFHYVPFPSLPKLDTLRNEFEAIQRALPGALVVVDSLRSLIAHYGLDVKDPSSIEKVLGAMMGAVKKPAPDTVPLTVVVLDHASMGTTAQSTYVAAWNAAKAQAVDAVYYWEKEDDFSEAIRGRTHLHVKDDRRGKLLRKHSYDIGGQGEGQPLHFEKLDAGSTLGKEEQRAVEIAEFVRAADEAQRHKDIVSRFDWPASTVDKAIKLALRRGWIAQDGDRKPYYAGDSVPPCSEPAI